MKEQSAFNRKKLETINIEKRDWMEELNLPPQMIKFVRKNSRALQLGGVLLLLFFLGYNGMQFYLSQQLQKSTALLAKASKIEDKTERAERLKEVVSQYGSTDAGLWARIDLANLSYEEGKYEEAAAYFQEALNEAKGSSSLVPLIHFGLANAYEQKGDLNDAAEHFQYISKAAGFERQGYLGLGRVWERQGKQKAALESYEKVLSLDDKEKTSTEEDWLEEKIRSLKKADPQAEGEKGSESKQ